jgi:hypothetical protein
MRGQVMSRRERILEVMRQAPAGAIITMAEAAAIVDATRVEDGFPHYGHAVIDGTLHSGGVDYLDRLVARRRREGRA